MKKKLFYLLSLLVLMPTSVFADVIDPQGPLESGTSLGDFTIVFVLVITIAVIAVIYSIIRSKRRK